MLLVVVAVLVAAAAAFLTMAATARRYRRKAVGDQSLLVDQWWLLFCLCQVLLASPQGPSALSLALSYVVYRAIVRVGRGRVRRHGADQGYSLLLLRAFGARGRSERLLRDVGAYWRYVGSVELIAGTDLASENLEPHEFLDVVRGTLSRAFLRDGDDLSGRVAALDRSPDADGRFRVNEMFCHDDTWREAVGRLVRIADAVLVDLRGLTPARRGVVFELHQLVWLGVLDRVVAVVDDRIDLEFVQATLEAAGAAGTAGLRAVREGRGGRADALALLGHLEASTVRASGAAGQRQESS